MSYLDAVTKERNCHNEWKDRNKLLTIPAIVVNGSVFPKRYQHRKLGKVGGFCFE